MARIPRRRVLRNGVAAATLAVGGGCTTRRDRRPTAAETDSPTPTTTAESTRPETETRTAAERITLAFSNDSSAAAVVHFSITSEGATISEGTVRVSAGEYESVDTEIRNTGAYELTVALDGGAQSAYAFDIGEYDVRMGSNLILTVYDGRTALMMEE